MRDQLDDEVVKIGQGVLGLILLLILVRLHRGRGPLDRALGRGVGGGLRLALGLALGLPLRLALGLARGLGLRGRVRRLGWGGGPGPVVGLGRARWWVWAGPAGVRKPYG